MFVKFLLVSEYIKLRAILITFAKREKFMHVLENRAIHLFISIHKRKERTAEQYTTIVKQIVIFRKKIFILLK